MRALFITMWEIAKVDRKLKGKNHTRYQQSYYKFCNGPHEQVTDIPIPVGKINSHMYTTMNLTWTTSREMRQSPVYAYFLV
jgi:hypothetical protein